MSSNFRFYAIDVQQRFFSYMLFVYTGSITLCRKLVLSIREQNDSSATAYTVLHCREGGDNPLASRGRKHTSKHLDLSTPTHGGDPKEMRFDIL